MDSSVELIGEIKVQNTLGEGIQWRACDQSVWWTDILECSLYRYDWRSKKLDTFKTPEPLGSFAFIDDGPKIVAAFASGFAFFNFETGAVDWLQRPKLLPGEGRFNDGRVDRQGRFWCGTMVSNPGDGAAPTGRLFCLDNRQNITEHIDGIHISNGLSWSPDGSVLYFADSLPGEIYAFDFNRKTGELSNKQSFFTAPKGGSPDGAAVDADGNLWSAHWGLGKVFAINKNGQKMDTFSVPTKQPSCVSFGGEELNVLFVTSARDGLRPDELENDPSAGNVFIYQTNYTGFPEQTYKPV